jgi:peptide/nickel transport system substrate-binding protein
MVGSGPYRFLANERVPGARAVYEKFAHYLPREDGVTNCLSGPKIAHFDRVEWRTISDVATAASALQTGEVDWWEGPASNRWPACCASTACRHPPTIPLCAAPCSPPSASPMS